MERERRASPRAHQPMRVLISDPGDALDDPYPGMILNRSRGGVRLAVGPLDIEEGTILGLRADVGVPFEVRVVHRSQRDNTIELGCAFLRADAWNIIGNRG